MLPLELQDILFSLAGPCLCPVIDPVQPLFVDPIRCCRRQEEAPLPKPEALIRCLRCAIVIVLRGQTFKYIPLLECGP